jgi:regulator of protease activity HflC (stomatin/prohibitin superfamily)
MINQLVRDVPSDDVSAEPRQPWRLRDWIRKHRTGLTVTGLVILFLFVFLIPRIFVLVGPGEAGVLYRPLGDGTLVDRVYGEGMWILFPLNRMYVYKVRVQETRRTLEVLTRDGLNVKLDLSIRYHPDRSMIGALHEVVGPDYVEKIVVPEVLSVVRHSVGNRTAEELYTGRARELAATPIAATGEAGAADDDAPPATNLTLSQIVETASDKISRKYVVIDAVILLRTTLPQRLADAIERKLEQEQTAESQPYRLQNAQAEIEIKRREAQANRILAASLTPALLQWKGVEATKELASSPNSKVVVIGNGPKGMPVILGGTTP